MKYARAFLGYLAITGLLLSSIAMCLALLNLINTDPIDLHRLRDVFTAFCACGVLYLAAHETPKQEMQRVLTRSRSLLEHQKAFPWIAGIMLALYVLDACTQHLAFRTGAHDFSMIDEAIHSAAGGGPLFSPVLGRSFLSEHFSPILLLVAPFHRLFSSPWLLVLLQPLLLWAAVWPFRALLARFTGFDLWQINLLCLLFLNHAIMISTLEYLFHMECALPLILLSTLYFAERKRYVLYACCVLALLCVKEDMGLYLAGLGVFYALFRKRVTLGLLTAVIGCVWTTLAIKTVMPLFSGSEAESYQFVSRWESWGTSPAGIISGFARRPIQLASHLFNADALLLLSSFLFLPLLHPLKGYWLIFILPWTINATSDFGIQSELKLYYGIPMFSFMAAAIVFMIQDKTIVWPKTPRMAAVVAVILVLFNCCHFKLPHIPRSRSTVLRKISEIPQSEHVIASACLFPILGYERDKSLIQQLSVPSSDFVLLKQGEGSWPLSEEQSYAYADLCMNNGFTELWEHEGFTCIAKTQDGQQDAHIFQKPRAVPLR